MLTSRLDRLFSLAAGCSVLLLLTAQQKLCPWLNEAPAEHAAQSTDAETTPPHDTESDDSPAGQAEKHKAPRLPLLLPDSCQAAAPRSLMADSQAEARQAVGWRDGVLAAGPRHGSGDSIQPASDAALAFWRVLQQPIPFSGIPAQCLRRTCPRDPALQFCILRNGPPRA
jgi:hypothetical protein